MNHSTFYPLAVFVHVAGVMALMALSGLEWATLHRLRRDPDPSQVMEALSALGKGQRLVPLGVPLVLLSGPPGPGRRRGSSPASPPSWCSAFWVGA